MFLALSGLLLNNTHSTKNKVKRNKTQISIFVDQFPIYPDKEAGVCASTWTPSLPPQMETIRTQPALELGKMMFDDSLTPQVETIRARLSASLSPGDRVFSPSGKSDQSRDIGRILTRTAPEDPGLTEIDVFGKEEERLPREELQRIVEERKRGRPLGLERQASGCILFHFALSCCVLIP